MTPPPALSVFERPAASSAQDRGGPYRYRLAFSGSQDGDYEISLCIFTNLDGADFGFLDGEPTQLTFNTGRSGTDPARSPDGEQIAFTHDSEVFVMNTDGSDRHRIATGNQTERSL